MWLPADRSGKTLGAINMPLRVDIGRLPLAIHLNLYVEHIRYGTTPSGIDLPFGLLAPGTLHVGEVYSSQETRETVNADRGCNIDVLRYH